MTRVDPAGVAFAALALLTLGSAAVVALSHDILRSAVALLGTLCGVAGLYVLLAADFLAATQLVVYVGGTLILFLFAAMLTARIDPASQSNEPRLPRKKAAVASIVLGGALVTITLDTIWPLADKTVALPSTAKIGHALLGPYAMPFELASLVLLASMVGALVIARRAVKPADSGQAERAP